MFRMLVHSSSGACDCVWVYCSGSMCVGVTVWFGWSGLVSLCRLRYCLSLHKDTTQVRSVGLSLFKYGCMFCMLLFNFLNHVFYCCVYVFLLLCVFCSVYSVSFVLNGTLGLSWLRFFRSFSSVVSQMPGHNSQRRGTVHTLPNLAIIFMRVNFILIALGSNPRKPSNQSS